MTVPSIIYAQYAPDQIKVDSLGIGLSEASNEFMNLSMSQYLIVGQFETNRPADPTGYNMIVDHEGVAIRTSILDRQNQPNEYALFVDGDTYITGRMITSNLVVLGGSNGSGSYLQGEGFWNLATDEDGFSQIDNLYYPAKVTLGNNFQARSNTHTLNISRAADRSIDHAQINIENTQDSQLRMGILGIARNSPAVINTPQSTRLEFHVGRDQDYFQPRYLGERYVTVTNPNTGETSNYTLIEQVDVPNYTTIGNSPHLMIDENGNVGIQTSSIPHLHFDLRIRDTVRPDVIGYYPSSDTPCLYVSKTAYASNLLMWDYESASIKHIDELYVRRLGVTIRADQILPGYFAPGNYSFVSNVSIGGPPDERYLLKVYGDANVTDNMLVDGVTRANHLLANDSITLDIASFCNDVYMNRDVIVNQAIRVRGQIYVEALSNTSDGETISTWNLIDFAAARPGYSNINIMGTGISTPGRLGVGILPSSGFVSDEVNHQTTIIKRDAYSTVFPNMFELELLDKTAPYNTRAAWIGHPQMAGGFNDASLLFVTPSSTYGDYQSTKKQNMYFYPGENMDPSSILILRPSNPPTLGVFEEKRVGLLTFNPRTTLDVRGSITFSEDLYSYNADTQQSFKLGLWKAQTFVNTRDVDGTQPLFNGLQYYNEDAPYVGVNGLPDVKYGMTVTGGLCSPNGYYTALDRKMAPWYDASDPNTSNNHVAPARSFALFSFGNVGIGVKTPSANLEIKDNYRSENGTTLKLVRSDDTRNVYTAIDMAGFNETWRVRTNDLLRTFEIANAASFSNHNTSNARLLWGKYNSQIQKYQLVVGCNLQALQSSIGNPTMANTSVLTVGGDMSVLGDVNISGQFRVMSHNVTVDGEAPAAPDLSPDDVFIGGANIVLTPGTNQKGVFIGDYSDAPINTTSLLRVYQKNPNMDTLATFKSTAANNRALIEIENRNGDVVRFGVLDPSASETRNVPFGFLDVNNTPYLSFKTEDTQLSKYVGFNTFSPTAHAHIYTEGYGSNMLKLTKQVLGNSSTSSASPHIELEKVYTDIAATRWTITGPDAAWEEKMALQYVEEGMSSPEEVFTFTRNGCFGIGNTTPEFALDITGTGKRGTLRLLNTNNDAAMPQLLFQSGDRVFGGDESFDYRMYTSNSEFNFDMQNVSERIPILSVNSNGHVGICTDASSNYQVTVKGSLNIVDGTMLIDGSSFLEGTQTDGGVSFRAANLYLRPNQNLRGGVVINNQYPTCNLFHIFSGVNCNLFVMDSSFDECQMHFRCMEGYQTNIFNMYRLAQSNQMMYWSFLPNSRNSFYVDPSQYNHSNVMLFGPKQNSDEFFLNMMGDVNIVARAPQLRLGDSSLIGASGSNTYFTTVNQITTNIGIGTSTPLAPVHLYGSRTANAAIKIEQGSSTGDIAVYARQGANKVVVNKDGNIGIGTAIARSALDIQSGRILVDDNTVATPSYSFHAHPSTGMYHSTDGIAFATNGLKRVEITNAGQLLIGSNTSVPLVTLQQNGTGDLVSMSTVTNRNAFKIQRDGNVGIGTSSARYPLHVIGNVGSAGSIIPTSNEAYDLGTPSLRWRDLYLSGNSLDIGGTKVTRLGSSGYLRVSCNTDILSRVIVSEVQLGDATTPQSITMTTETPGNITFRIADNTGINPPITASPILRDTNNGSTSIGSPTLPGQLAVGAGQYTGLIVQQYTRSNIAEFYDCNTIRVSMDIDGRIGFGTLSPQSYLDVLPSNIFSCNLVNFGNKLVVDANGNVGIGTTLPNGQLHIVEDTSTRVSYSSIAYDNYLVWSEYANRTQLSFFSYHTDGKGYWKLPDFGFDFFINGKNCRNTTYVAGGNGSITFDGYHGSFGTMNSPTLFVGTVNNDDIDTTRVSYYKGDYDGIPSLYIFQEGVEMIGALGYHFICIVIQADGLIRIFMDRIDNSANFALAFGLSDGKGGWMVELPENNTTTSFTSRAYAIQLINRGNIIQLEGRCTITKNVYMGANLEVYGNSVTHGNNVTDSDIRLKTDIKRIESALNKVCALTGYTFQMNGANTRSTGIIAQEVQQVLPEVVHQGENGYLGVAYGNMMGLIVEAIKEIRCELNELKQK